MIGKLIAASIKEPKKDMYVAFLLDDKLVASTIQDPCDKDGDILVRNKFGNLLSFPSLGVPIDKLFELRIVYEAVSTDGRIFPMNMNGTFCINEEELSIEDAVKINSYLLDAKLWDLALSEDLIRRDVAVGFITNKQECPYDFTSRCTIDRCDCPTTAYITSFPAADLMPKALFEFLQHVNPIYSNPKWAATAEQWWKENKSSFQ